MSSTTVGVWPFAVPADERCEGSGMIVAEPGRQRCPVCNRVMTVPVSSHRFREHKRLEALTPTTRKVEESRERKFELETVRGVSHQPRPSEALIVTRWLEELADRLAAGESLSPDEMGTVAAFLQVAATISSIVNRSATLVQSRLQTR